MPTPPRLEGAARAEALAGLPGWTPCTDRDAIARTYRFASFRDAFAFMTRAAFDADRADHHPEWSNVYATVEVVLTTHDAGGLTARDIALAHAFDAAAAGFAPGA